MEKKMRFGLVLDRLAVLKETNFWANYEQLMRAVFSCFHGQKYPSVHTEKLHKNKLRKPPKKRYIPSYLTSI
jgi:hypothetical protein